MKGYYRFPTIFSNHIVFVSDDDLWKVDINNQIASRLTANLSPIHAPYFSPDGKFIAYVGTEDGNTEIYLIPSQGGVAKRLTYEGAFISKIASWNKNNIIYASDLNQPFGRISELRKINIKDSQSKSMEFGVSSNIAISKNFTLIAEFLSLPTTSKMLSMHEAYAERTNIKFTCTKGRLAPAKIDGKAARTAVTNP